MTDEEIAQLIISLKKKDLEFRNQLVESKELGNGYHHKMESIQNENADILNELIDKFGYPTEEKVGKEANHAAWLIIQHAIGKPAFMKKCVAILAKINPLQFAYLFDRISVLQGKPQHYGTQFDWDENGILNPNLCDNLFKVDQRRKTLGLNSLDEQTKLMRIQAINDNQYPPSNYSQRQNEIIEWKKKVGWI